jgi:hypothetical protein
MQPQRRLERLIPAQFRRHAPVKRKWFPGSESRGQPHEARNDRFISRGPIEEQSRTNTGPIEGLWLVGISFRACARLSPPSFLPTSMAVLPFRLRHPPAPAPRVCRMSNARAAGIRFNNRRPAPAFIAVSWLALRVACPKASATLRSFPRRVHSTSVRPPLAVASLPLVTLQRFDDANAL